MDYPIKTLDQLPLVLKGFRKQRGLTQATMAERLGITQQSYAWFEANPATATLERLFTVLRLLDVEISLDQAGAPADTGSETVPAARKPARVVAKARKKDAW
jgi:HTH-type transcriptional regulator/antitoxin HipB